eukprot:SAG31_NODE_12013_length_978_cov_0.802048_1_plen_62_part_10
MFFGVNSDIKYLASLLQMAVREAPAAETKLALTRSKRSWSALQRVGIAEEGLRRSSSSEAAQ